VRVAHLGGLLDCFDGVHVALLGGFLDCFDGVHVAHLGGLPDCFDLLLIWLVFWFVFLRFVYCSKCCKFLTDCKFLIGPPLFVLVVGYYIFISGWYVCDSL
jgi:hypothetical protein